MRRRRVFIDSTFVQVLLDPSDDHHGEARAMFDRLLVEFERGTTLLYSHDGVVVAIGDRRAAEVLGVCDVARVRRWIIRAAAGVERRHPELGRHRATTLVLMRRWRIGEIASFDSFFARHGVPTVPLIAD